MKIWGVRDFYSRLERLSEEGSAFTFGYLALVLTSTLIATGGLLANSVAVIIGSMLIAPFLGPSRAICIGGVFRKWRIVGRGLVKQLLGLVIIGSSIAFLVTVIFSRLMPELMVTPEIMARMLPTLKDVYLALFIAIASGAAASLALVATPRIVSEPWQELLDTMIGAEIAISLIPPASVIGIGLAFGRYDISVHALSLLLINVVSLNIIGSMLILYFWGVGPKPLQLERKLRELVGKQLKDIVKANATAIEVTLHSYEKAEVHVRLLLSETNIYVDQLLAKRVAEEIKRKTGVTNTVRITIAPVYTYTSFNRLT